MSIKEEMVKSRIIRDIQEGIPLTRGPFKILSEKIGVGEEELIHMIKTLKEEKIIRQISPIYDTKMLGYDSALVALKIKDENLKSAAQVINTYPGVSHNYERNHAFNLWFTIAVPPDSKFSLNKTVKLLVEKTKPEDHIILRSKRVFKIGVKLDPEGSGLEREESKAVNHSFTPLTGEERRIIITTQVDMPLTKRPFSIYAEILKMDEDGLIKKLKEFKERGVMRRFAAILYHRKVGFSVNGMAVWKAPEQGLEEIGSKIASFKAVSHCYERTTDKTWQYNLFSMIHGKSKDEIEEIVKEIKKETNLKEYSILSSCREFKKKRVSYFTKDLYNWEERHITPCQMNA